ncbi:phenol hydroxylase subunit P4 [Myxococcota bacterium]|nr:phenol hydroxylase subunit P4 [Myxococcota bacterium]
MTTPANYVGEIKDRLENFHGNQLLYVGWDQHLMFCAPFAFPFPPQMLFRDVVEKVFPGSFGYHPDFAKIDWSKVEWLKSGKPWKPDFDKSLADNGLVHKDVLRFRTPGLDGIKGSAS